ncbi:MAG TPA: hypothetical protein VFM46_12655 [Pseudomonadales bacterium]|nr:hypothetical protein [Pseudomonadales bacterium]
MQPPNHQEDEDDATLMRPTSGAPGGSSTSEASDPDATQLRPPAQDDATLIKNDIRPPQELGPLDTARLQKSPIPAHYKTPHNKLGLRAVLGAILVLSWVAALWWYKLQHHVSVVQPVQTATDNAIPPSPSSMPLAAPPKSTENTHPPLVLPEQSEPATEPPDATPTKPFTAVSHDMDELFEKAKRAIANDRLEPADQNDTATGLLIQMNMVNAKDERVLALRKLLAEAHLKLSKNARSQNNWEAAEHHTEEAWHVRDTNSYLTPP